MKTFTPATARAGAIHLTIDGRRYEVDAQGKNLLHVCL